MRACWLTTSSASTAPRQKPCWRPGILAFSEWADSRSSWVPSSMTSSKSFSERWVRRSMLRGRACFSSSLGHRRGIPPEVHSTLTILVCWTLGTGTLGEKTTDWEGTYEIHDHEQNGSLKVEGCHQGVCSFQLSTAT